MKTETIYIEEIVKGIAESNNWSIPRAAREFLNRLKNAKNRPCPINAKGERDWSIEGEIFVYLESVANSH